MSIGIKNQDWKIIEWVPMTEIDVPDFYHNTTLVSNEQMLLKKMLEINLKVA